MIWNRLDTFTLHITLSFPVPFLECMQTESLGDSIPHSFEYPQQFGWGSRQTETSGS